MSFRAPSMYVLMSSVESLILYLAGSASTLSIAYAFLTALSVYNCCAAYATVLVTDFIKVCEDDLGALFLVEISINYILYIGHFGLGQ